MQHFIATVGRDPINTISEGILSQQRPELTGPLGKLGLSADLADDQLNRLISRLESWAYGRSTLFSEKESIPHPGRVLLERYIELSHGRRKRDWLRKCWETGPYGAQMWNAMRRREHRIGFPEYSFYKSTKPRRNKKAFEDICIAIAQLKDSCWRHIIYEHSVTGRYADFGFVIENLDHFCDKGLIRVIAADPINTSVARLQFLCSRNAKALSEYHLTFKSLLSSIRDQIAWEIDDKFNNGIDSHKSAHNSIKEYIGAQLQPKRIGQPPASDEYHSAAADSQLVPTKISELMKLREQTPLWRSIVLATGTAP